MDGLNYRAIARPAAAAALALLAGCGDARINDLSAGITRDSAVKILGAGTSAADSLANVYRQETYLIDGQMLNVLMYNKDGIKQAQDSTLGREQLTPVVTVGGKVTGWGWAHYDSVAKANNIAASRD